MATGVGRGSTTLVRPHLGAKMLARELRRTLPNLYLCAKTHFAKNGHSAGAALRPKWSQPTWNAAVRLPPLTSCRLGSRVASEQSNSDRARAVLSEAGAPLSWTSERSERGRQRLTSAGLSERSEQQITKEGTCFSSPSDDEVGGSKARSARSERQRVKPSDQGFGCLLPPT